MRIIGDFPGPGAVAIFTGSIIRSTRRMGGTVAPGTGFGNLHPDTLRVAFAAFQGPMAAHQGKAGALMIETPDGPAGRRVARCTRGGPHPVVGVRMAIPASGRGSPKPPFGMAVAAEDGRMLARQREFGFLMVEPPHFGEPFLVMTGLTGSAAKPAAVGIPVTSVAIPPEGLLFELRQLHAMAFPARDLNVFAFQGVGRPGVVEHRGFPPVRRMARRTVRPVHGAVLGGVAIGATHRGAQISVFAVATFTSDRTVRSGQRKIRRPVIEFFLIQVNKLKIPALVFLMAGPTSGFLQSAVVTRLGADIFGDRLMTGQAFLSRGAPSQFMAASAVTDALVFRVGAGQLPGRDPLGRGVMNPRQEPNDKQERENSPVHDVPLHANAA